MPPSQERTGLAARARARYDDMSRGGKIGALGATVGLALFIVVIVISGSSPAASRGTAVPPAARTFSLPALGQPGRAVSLSQYAGRPLVVNFFASWCEPCQRETPLLARFYRSHSGQVAVVGVDVNDGVRPALSFTRRSGVSYPVGTDPQAATATRYGVIALPQTFFLNAGHRVVKRVFGAITPAELAAGLAGMR